MSILCRYCGKRVASRASLAGHYRRKHPDRVPARSGASSVLRSGQKALPESAAYQRGGGIASETIGAPAALRSAASRNPKLEFMVDLGATGCRCTRALARFG